ncbi:Predicted Zn-dependent peptidase [Melghirimyces thermohalophilus]|uniref:Predicted Zn-dependent peptidase n=1 Tax=Melghirimyces thermohalophilus TaxID=1236220 RepID=A0A1G6J383_9BACL|nr:pitrilysin family protein [Melghirimyces thermohalophilus]SDC13043.1 Predicted Zn-dependent peptidase [Melghirimyces thermohalophilus]
MEKIEHSQLKETIYYEQLPNGLKVYLLPKPGYNKTYATFTTRYGSIDNHFQPPGKEEIRVPDGIAHFLEHKMFEEPEGDVFNKFSKQGASANAFTSFNRTAYLFSCTENVEKNLQTLIDFVQHPYFTDESVEKEKGIIGQEIRMYDDNPDWRCHFGLIGAMFQNHPVKIDIAGTIESISKIDKETLYTCYHTFYHPSNMLLFVVGPIDPEAIMDQVRQNQADKAYEKQEDIRRIYPEEDEKVAQEKVEAHLSVGISKCLFGFKENRIGLSGDDLVKQELATEVMLEALFGQGSELYQSLYDEGLIDDHFGYDYTLEEGYGFSMVGGDTADPDQLLARIREELPSIKETGIPEETVDRIRKKKLGNYLRFYNSPEWIANQFTHYRLNDTDLFNIIPMLEQLKSEEVNKRLQEHIDWDRFAVSLVRPINEQ